MIHQIEKLPNAPIIVASLQGEMSATAVADLFAESIKIVLGMPGPYCFVTNFQQASNLFSSDFNDVLAYFTRGMKMLRAERPTVFFAFIGTDTTLKLITRHLEQAGFRVPVFESIEHARSYLNLKVDGLHLKASLGTKDTGDLAETTATLAPDAALAQVSMPSPSGKTRTFPERSILRLVALATQKSVLVVPDHGILLGRRHGTEKPDVDLSLWGGVQYGVSRRHAKIVVDEQRLLQLIDLGSANGTFLNGEKLTPFRPKQLNDGDELSLGALIMRGFYQVTDE